MRKKKTKMSKKKLLHAKYIADCNCNFYRKCHETMVKAWIKLKAENRQLKDKIEGLEAYLSYEEYEFEKELLEICKERRKAAEAEKMAEAEKEQADIEPQTWKPKNERIYNAWVFGGRRW